MTNVSVTKRPCDHGVKPPCPPCSSTNLTNVATSPCPPCSLTNIANMVTSHCPPCSLTNSTVITTIMYGTKIMYLNPESLLRYGASCSTQLILRDLLFSTYQ